MEIWRRFMCVVLRSPQRRDKRHKEVSEGLKTIMLWSMETLNFVGLSTIRIGGWGLDKRQFCWDEKAKMSVDMNVRKLAGVKIFAEGWAWVMAFTSAWQCRIAASHATQNRKFLTNRFFQIQIQLDKKIFAVTTYFNLFSFLTRRWFAAYLL